MDERGSNLIEATIAVGFLFALIFAFANIEADSYVKGVAHSAVDQGVRAGSRIDIDPVSTCQDRAQQVLASVLAGRAGDGAEVTCAADDEVVTARVRLALPAWLPMVSDSTVDVTGQARREREPE